MNRPVFICGCMRSGTTLLMMLLDCSKGFAFPGTEPYFMANFYGCQRRKRESLPTPAEALPVLGRMAHDRYKAFCSDPRVVAEIADATSYAEGYDLLNRAMADAVGKVRWGEKTPGNEYFAKDIIELFPGSRLVYVLRDHRDVLASKRTFTRHQTRPRAPHRFESLHSAWLWRSSIEAHFWNLANLPADRYRQLRYEDLVLHPDRAMDDLSEFLGEDLSPVVSERDGRFFYRHLTGRTHLAMSGSSNTTYQTEKPEENEISRGSVGRSRQSLPLWERLVAWAICSKLSRATDDAAPSYPSLAGPPTSYLEFGLREKRYANRLTHKAKFWFGQKGRRLTDLPDL
jgi:hypothetical protein